MIFLWRLPVYSPRCNNANPVVTSKKLDVLTRFWRNFSRLAKLLYYPIQVYLNLLRMSRNLIRVVINWYLVKVCQNAIPCDNCFSWQYLKSQQSVIHSDTFEYNVFCHCKDLQSRHGKNCNLSDAGLQKFFSEVYQKYTSLRWNKEIKSIAVLWI